MLPEGRAWPPRGLGKQEGSQAGWNSQVTGHQPAAGWDLPVCWEEVFISSGPQLPKMGKKTIMF